MAIIDKPSDYFNTKLYTGNGYPTSNSNNITGVGFQPDLVWLKVRDSNDNHALFDNVRGVYKRLATNLTATESNRTTALTSFDSDGFTLGTNNETNNENSLYASWNWKAGGTASSNTDGSITSSVSANTTSGFSIVSYTLPSSGIVTVGHGLGTKPAMLITKSRDIAYNWDVLHQSLNDDGVGRIILNSTGAFTTGNSYGSTTPTSSVFSFNADFYGASDNVTYCFAEKKGFSKFGSYTGNGSSDGTFIYTGFKPAYFMVKLTNGANNWNIFDNKRNPFNDLDLKLYADTSTADVSAYGTLDFTSNGIKCRNSDGAFNGSGQSYIYMAFAENPFVTSTGVPATAR